MKKIILIGTTGTSVYGFRADLIKKLLNLNYQVYAFVSEYTHEDLNKIRCLGAIPIVYSLHRSGLNPFLDVLSIYQLVREIKKIQPDLVFSYFSKPIIYGTLAARIANTPNVVGMLEGLGYSFTEQPYGLSKKARIVRWIQVALYKLSLPLLDKIIFLNPDDPKDLLDKYHIKTAMVEIIDGIGVDLQNYPYFPIKHFDTIRFLFIGRLLKEKGIHEFITAAKIVKIKYPNTVFTILGEIDYMNPGALSERELNDYINSNLIEYIGYVSNVQDWISRSHIFVLPSYREGLPRSTQEAMAIGRPILTTDVPGCRETVIDGVNGFLVPRWNVEALVEKMVFLINYPEKIEEMGICSRKIAEEKFDSQKINDRILKILL